jgi:hypothetical protein
MGNRLAFVLRKMSESLIRPIDDDLPSNSLDTNARLARNILHLTDFRPWYHITMALAMDTFLLIAF